MKHFYTLVMLLCSFAICSAEVITEKPDGTEKYYQRSGGLTYRNDGSQLYLENQSGFTYIVTSADGRKAWIKNPISGFFPEGTTDQAWIVGDISDNGTKIRVNLGQQVFFDETQSDYLELALMKKDESSHSIVYNVDPVAAQATYTINGDKVSLDGTSENYVLGLVWSKDKSWSGFADYSTVYTEYFIPTPVTPPAGLQTKTYPLSAIEYMNEKETVYNTEVTIGFDNNDVYIKGLDKFIPSAWIKGTLEGTVVTFPVQYIGEDTAERLHFLTSWKVGFGGVDDLRLNYYADYDAFESTAAVLINSNPTINHYYAYYRSLYIGERPAMTELPEGAKTRNMTMTGKIDNTGYSATSFTRIIQTAEADGKVYFKGLSFDLPEAWTEAEVQGNEVVIPSGTYVGFGDASAVYLHGGETNNMGQKVFRDDIRFTFDAENDKYTCNHIIFECSARTPRTYTWEYSPGVVIYFDPNAPTGADPEDLEQVPYIFSGEVHGTKNTQLYPEGAFSRKVTMAFDGYIIYVKGLSLECPDGWTKGEMIDNVATFKNGQLQGTYNGSEIFTCGYDMMGWQNADLTMKHDPATKKFTFTQDFSVNTDPSNVNSKTVWIGKHATLTPDASGIDSVIDNEPAGETVIYNLQGIRVEGRPTPGIYIMNGKKVYIK